MCPQRAPSGGVGWSHVVLEGYLPLDLLHRALSGLRRDVGWQNTEGPRRYRSP
ncbi:hypothetical protein HUA78_02850 [Myxococcus sp. CA033]|uniref:hypothetical protein n=1 Tax=unclassified Myxococcus TaxID=2648731 RepID=UPI00157B718F|nr:MULTISPECIES: hypothetical protein [unclassified Myxococcus]NTX33366.1 hypothetical protein [Myxococcus sp. CA033]